MSATNETYAEWLNDNPPPDLMALVEKFGGFAYVPPAAWTDYDKSYREWNEERMRRYAK